MSGSPLLDTQLAMARYLRNPAEAPAPAGIESRRLRIYEDLVYRNIEGFVSGGFPVLRSLYGDDDWHELVRSFIDKHRCDSPYFLEISQEFLQYLLEEHERRACDPPFLGELAHYEWVELALDVSTETLPEASIDGDLSGAVLTLSPLAWVLAYHFPVHRIGPGFRPGEPGDPCYLVVYRDRGDVVRFMEVNAATARLLELLRENREASAVQLLGRLASELGMAQGELFPFGLEQLDRLLGDSILVPAAGV